MYKRKGWKTEKNTTEAILIHFSQERCDPAAECDAMGAREKPLTKKAALNPGIAKPNGRWGNEENVIQCNSK